MARGSRPGRLLAGLLPDLLAGGPALVWCEPTPTRVRHGDFAGLWAGEYARLTSLVREDVALDEARLFWLRGMLHLVADGQGTRWAAFREREPGAAPTLPVWLGSLAGSMAGQPEDWAVVCRCGQV